MARAQDKTLAIGKTVIGVPGSRGAEKPRPKRNLKINWYAFIGKFLLMLMMSLGAKVQGRRVVRAP
jgi:hypothetical protein